jgi:hypothetical protein
MDPRFQTIPRHAVIDKAMGGQAVGTRWIAAPDSRSFAV